jgi:hypothetical protein
MSANDDQVGLMLLDRAQDTIGCVAPNQNAAAFQFAWNFPLQ